MSKFIAVVTALTILAAGLSGCGATEPSGRPYDADKIDAAIIARTNDFSFVLLGLFPITVKRIVARIKK